ncbi:TetR/AcrR family transcriptional regulator [Labedella phragmitis]|uniref:TetR/AcrR family transcriptional regulator n=1 Tax=Labedella phragmitis TaxID=2498849 RepID=A0A3S4BBC7_9MICO|nr:TetR/AcrR family transcriptional regulator [Labedella phragmitis]RWZ46123.1 TetR/AcrR family transcriptional regulator [Labedella phragmitis]
MSAPDGGAVRPADVAGTARRRGPYAKSAERRRAIVDAAFDVFASRGYRGGSFREVAERVGMSQTSLLHYFPSKEDLLVAVLARRDDVEPEPDPDEVRCRAGEGARGRAARFALSIEAQAEANVGIPGVIELYAVLSGEAVTADHPGREYFVERFENLRRDYVEELTALRELGVLRDGVDPVRAAASIVALWDGIQLQWLFDRDAVDMAAALRDYLSLILRLPEH